MNAPPAGALGSLCVLELAEGVAGEYCGRLLADFGATVIKIERPGCGSPTRALGPFVPGCSGAEASGLFAYLNAGKQSVTLDLEAADGRDTLTALLARVDVIVDDHALPWLLALGLDPDTVAARHPGHVLCSITPFGLNPPEDRRHATDLTVFHASGWGYHTPSAADPAQPPLKGPGRFLPSYEAGLEGALCVAACVFDRMASGRGRVVEVSAQAVLASRLDYVLGQMVAGDMPVGESRNALDLGGPAGIFPCRDGFAYIWMSAPAHWEALRTLLGDPAWMHDFPDRWLERECTPERVAECRRHIASWLAGCDRNEVAAEAQALGLTLVAVNAAADLHASPQYRFREFFRTRSRADEPAALHPGVPYLLSGTPVRLATPAPHLGEHSALLAAGGAR